MRGLSVLGRAVWWLAVLALFSMALAGPLAAQNTVGADLYRAHCAACHGRQGEGGRGVSLTALKRAGDNDALFSIIRKGIPGTEMPAAPLGDDEIRDIVVFVRSLQRSTAAQAPPSSRGEQVYRKQGCSACHTIGDDGGTLGPDLSRIGARRDRNYLRRALLEPDADIPESFGQYRWVIVIPDNFLQVRLTASDGRQITGARVNEDTFSIQVRDAAGRIHSFWKEDLKELHEDWGKSPMPGYRDKLTDSEIDDLVAWLGSLRGGR
jgi:cytochrome c oxidase cbb3-type subunit III